MDQQKDKALVGGGQLAPRYQAAGDKGDKGRDKQEKNQPLPAERRGQTIAPRPKPKEPPKEPLPKKS